MKMIEKSDMVTISIKRDTLSLLNRAKGILLQRQAIENSTHDSTINALCEVFIKNNGD